MSKHYNVAIDGPSGAGKSTIAKILSSRLNIVYLDTGALYRAVGLKAYRDGWAEDDGAVAGLIGSIDIRVGYDKETGKQHVYLGSEDVSEEIRKDFVSGYGSRFSALPSVRAALLSLQREIAAEHSSVLDGRDIGTFVLPDARFKFFLTASSDVRAARRYKELIARGQTADYEQVKRDIEERDFRDSTRAVAPLKKASDAIEIDSSELTADEVAEKMISIIRSQL